MNITILGAGYVGLVTGACLADFGLDVVCVDIDESKIKSLENSKIPFYEPGLKELVEKNTSQGRLKFSTSVEEAINNSEVVFLAVGTPPKEDGSADLSFVREAALTFAKSIGDDYKIIVSKSTVPVGTAKDLEKIILDYGVSADKFDVVSNPEFLREGASIEDFMRPNRIVVGTASDKAMELMKNVYSPLFLNDTPFVFTTNENAELIKYAANAFLATKISFINEMANLCEEVGGDVKVISKALGMDKRIGPKFLHAGPGYGGSCFPKDTRALSAIAKSNNYEFKIIDAVIKINEEQKVRSFQKIKTALGSDLKGKTICALGLSFKPNTDDIRESSSIDMIKMLINEGAKVNAYDPVAMDNAKAELGDDKNITYFEDTYSAIDGADCVVIMTEWNEFRNLDLPKVSSLLKTPIFIDLRIIYKEGQLKGTNLQYITIGKKPS